MKNFECLKEELSLNNHFFGSGGTCGVDKFEILSNSQKNGYKNILDEGFHNTPNKLKPEYYPGIAAIGKFFNNVFNKIVIKTLSI